MCDGGRVMNRLLLGDVGTGKTAVAACALAVAADSGTQACVMAPTGVLARQYADKTGPLLSQAGMSWALLTGATPAAERERIHAQLESGELDVLFGTHAVLSDNVAFKHLSLVVIDEQHRFGVGQRNALRAKGRVPIARYDGDAHPAYAGAFGLRRSGHEHHSPSARPWCWRDDTRAHRVEP